MRQEHAAFLRGRIAIVIEPSKRKEVVEDVAREISGAGRGHVT